MYHAHLQPHGRKLHLKCTFLPTHPGNLHRNPDRTSSSVAAAHGGSSDLSPAGPGPRRAHPLPPSLLQDPQQGAAAAGIPSDPVRPAGQLDQQHLKFSKGEDQREGEQNFKKEIAFCIKKK